MSVANFPPQLPNQQYPLAKDVALWPVTADNNQTGSFMKIKPASPKLLL